MSDEMLKAGADVLEKLTDLLHKLAGPASEELGETIRDHVKVFRMRRQISLLKKIEQMCGDAGFRPRIVDSKLLLTSMDAASVESDEELSDMWAALIANAADPRRTTPVHTYFPELLRQLTKDQAVLLLRMYEGRKDFPLKIVVVNPYTGQPQPIGAWDAERLSALYERGEYLQTDVAFEMAVENLLRLGLMAYHLEEENDDGLGYPLTATIAEAMLEYKEAHRFEMNRHRYYLSKTGEQLLEACTRPQK